MTQQEIQSIVAHYTQDEADAVAGLTHLAHIIIMPN